MIIPGVQIESEHLTIDACLSLYLSFEFLMTTTAGTICIENFF